MPKSVLTRKLVLGILIFFISWAAYYYPVYKKGYPPGGELSEAKSYAVTGTFNTEDNKGLLLPVNRIAGEGKPIATINQLTTLLYAYIFKIAGFNNWSLETLPVLIAVTLGAIFNVLFFWLVAEFWGIEVGLFSSIIVALMPVRVLWAMLFNTYEFGLIFFLIGFWLFLKRSKVRNLIISSVLLAIAALARNALAISFVPLFLFDLYESRSRRRALAFALPFVIIFGSTLTSHTWLPAQNGYVAREDLQKFSVIYGEVFPDPYTYYFNKDNYVSSLQAQGPLGSTEKHFFEQWGYKVGLMDKLRAYKETAIFYFKNLLSLTILGGPLILFLSFMGTLWLWSKERKMFWLLGSWFVIWFGYLVFIESTTNVDHFLEILIPTGITTGLGIHYLFEKVNPHRRLLWVSIVSLFLVGHLAYANFWSLFDVYTASHADEVHKYISKLELADPKESIAVGDGLLTYMSYYDTDKATIYFDPNTVTQLIKSNKLREAFKIYNVNSVIGYNNSLSEEIKRQTGVQVITLP